MIELIILWILVTFLVGSLAGLLGKKFGVEYPIALVSALVIMANVFGSKIVQFGSFSVPAGVIVFSMTFYITDLLSEKWGRKYAQRAIWAGFYSNILFVISVYVVLLWPAASYSVEFSKVFAQVLSLTPRIVIASLIAYLVSQNHDVWSYHFWKKLTKGKHMWLRNNASTIVSQLLDSVIFILIAFYGVFPILPLILGQWLAKTIIALLDTPFLYVTAWLMDKMKKE